MAPNTVTRRFFLLGFLISSSYIVTFRKLFSQQQGSPQPWHEESLLPLHPTRHTKTVGSRIVEQSFRQSYSDLIGLCDFSNHSVSQKSCMENVKELGQSISAFTAKWPWWFHTLLRDGNRDGSGLHGKWHLLNFPNPALQLCVYEKGATKHWRKIHCDELNKTTDVQGTHVTNCFFRQGPDVLNAPKAVFLRDPLERFLSAFLDKCSPSSPNYINEKHCQPTSLFQPKENETTGSEVAAYKSNPRTLFQIYVDTFPLRWDVHFFPLSLYCGGLFHRLKTYDFVGSMDEDFYHDLELFTKKYPSLNESVRNRFALQNRKAKNGTNHGIEQQASLHVHAYYTPHTVQRVLQYMAIDYVSLNMTIPQWAEDILSTDETFVL
eukprot:Nitzschia sp. Nitz4//scaffold5_size260463//165337//166565//NITZ4_000996-RA/size260463-snap-gene-0.48-mRNA-1//-1//CDS//3329555382//8334//frame0